MGRDLVIYYCLLVVDVVRWTSVISVPSRPVFFLLVTMTSASEETLPF